MVNTTLCYIERGDEYLMLHRVKLGKDQNAGKWIGVGGHFEEGESPEDCVIREVLEETGLTIREPVLRGIITFVFPGAETEYMFLFTADQFSGEMIDPDDCPEGVLRWVKKEMVTSLPIWPGDKIFLERLQNDEPFFSLKLVYNEKGELIN